MVDFWSCQQSLNLFRRTGKVINITARKNEHGFENVDDYFPDSGRQWVFKDERLHTRGCLKMKGYVHVGVW